MEIECKMSENITKNYSIVIGRGVTNIKTFFDINKPILKKTEKCKI